MSGFKAPEGKMKIGFKLGNLSLDKKKGDKETGGGENQNSSQVKTISLKPT